MRSPKRSHEVTLIGEAHGYRDLGGRLTAVQQCPGVREAEMGLVHPFPAGRWY